MNEATPAELVACYRDDAAKRMQSTHLVDQVAQKDARTGAAKVAGPPLGSRPT